MTKMYDLPSFLNDVVSQEAYERWLHRKAQAHVKRDRLRGNSSASGSAYKQAIHAAIIESDGCDAYTGELLDWKRISQFNNEEAQMNGRHYKKSFALLPTVDHVGDGQGSANFKICGWRTNDAKNDLDLAEFISVCQSVLKHHGFVISQGD